MAMRKRSWRLSSREGALGLGALALTACRIDTPNPIPPPGGSVPVDRLSELGIFEEPLAQLVPRKGVVPYDVIVSLYADGAQKRRFMILPPGTELHGQAADGSDRWQVPTGTYFVKTFYFPKDARDASSGMQLVETRFLVKLAQGYQVSTYLWDSDQLDAVASGGNLDVPVQWIDEAGSERLESFHVPGTSLCQSCHSDRALGIRTRQMDVTGTYPGPTNSQLDYLVASGLLDARPAEPVVLVNPSGGASLDARARSYLDANCSHCHGPQGLAAGTGVLFDYENTAHDLLPLCRSTETVDGRNHVIVPGDPGSSEFLARMESSDPFVRMPMGPTRIPDGVGIAVLSQWVAAMTPPGCP
jgi:uncharacterized repeat protein (TIGR03806 family)